MRRPAVPALGFLILLVLLAACSGGSKKSRSSSSTSAVAPATTTTSPTTTGPVSTSTTTATTGPGTATTTTIATSGSNVKISKFTYIGDNPVGCNAPTSIELKWTTSGAAKVTMSIDGSGVFASYPNGTRDVLLPLACDGKTHTYKLTATAGGATASQSISVQTKKTS
jgi:ABC-type Fe3+-hydroxamate transport system substrate-binding protein